MTCSTVTVDDADDLGLEVSNSRTNSIECWNSYIKNYVQMVCYMKCYAPCTQLFVMNFVNLAMGLFFTVAKILKFVPNLRCALKRWIANLNLYRCSRENNSL